MEKSAKFERSANYEQRNKTIVKSSTSNPYSSAKEYSYSNNNNNNNNEYKSKHFEVDVRKKDDEIVPVSKDEEWTKSKKVINHKTRQIETRIQRQIVMEDGKVIADSGPQITQRTKEDVKTEELEASNGKGGKGDVNSLDKFSEGYKTLPGESVISEKVETRNTTREARQEQLQYHDESIKELTGYDIHRKALASPNELIQLDDGEIDSERPRGKLIHYAAKSKKFADREETREVAKKQRDGTITTEKTMTHHHEEVDDDELPEDQINLSSLPEASKETTKEIQYHKDWKDSLNRASSQSKYSVENEKRNDDRSRYSSTERKSESYEKDRSSQFNRSQEREMSFGREEKYANEKTSSSRYSPDSLKRQSPIGGTRSTYDKYDANYSVDNRYQSHLNRRDESRYSNRSVASSSKEKPFKEDASVQASFSEDSSDDEAYGRTSSRNKKHETETRSHKIKVESSSHGMSSTDRPKGTYYFGQENREPKKSYLETNSECAIGKTYESKTDHREREELRSMKNEERKIHSSLSRSSSAMEKTYNDSVDWFNSLDAKTLMDDLERECRIELPIARDTSNSSTNRRPREDDSANGRTKTSGEIKGNVKHEYKSTANGQVISDTSRNEAFQQSFNSAEERKDATRSFNQLMDDTFGKSSRNSMSPLLYDGSIRHIPIERQDSRQSQSRSSSAARDYNSSNRRLYDSFRTDSPSRSSDYLRYSDKSPSRSPERRGTFTKSRVSPTISRSSPTNTKTNADLWSGFEPYSSESLRKSKYTDYADKKHSTAKDSYSRSYNSSYKTEY